MTSLIDGDSSMTKRLRTEIITRVTRLRKLGLNCCLQVHKYPREDTRDLYYWAGITGQYPLPPPPPLHTKTFNIQQIPKPLNLRKDRYFLCDM